MAFRLSSLKCSGGNARGARLSVDMAWRGLGLPRASQRKRVELHFSSRPVLVLSPLRAQFHGQHVER
jgi:hypothetical protein